MSPCHHVILCCPTILSYCHIFIMSCKFVNLSACQFVSLFSAWAFWSLQACNFLFQTNCDSLYSGKIKATTSRQATLSARGYMAEIYEPYSVEFINWLFQHLHKVYRGKCSKEFIDRVLEPECVKKLYSGMFQNSGSRTDDLLFESAVIANEIDEGITFEESLKSLKERLDSEISSTQNVEKNEKKVALALYDFPGQRKSQMPFRKEDLLLVEPSSRKWLYAEKGHPATESGWVPHNYISILERVCDKTAKMDYQSEENNSLSFSKGDLIQTYLIFVISSCRSSLIIIESCRSSFSDNVPV